MTMNQFQQGDFEGGLEIFSNVRDMFQVAWDDPKYAKDFYDYMVEGGMLIRIRKKINDNHEN